MDQSFLSATQTPPTSPAISEDYSDIIFRYRTSPDVLLQDLSRYTPQIVDTQYSILHAPLTEHLATSEEIGYASVPKLYTFIDTVSLEASGILAIQLQPYLALTGRGVLMGFLDSGIDYTHPAFRNPDGTTRILRIWDQTDQTGNTPAGMNYGTEYTDVQLNEALFSADSASVVPEQDTNGHGTSAAGIACGSADPDNDFTGAAPNCGILFVRLKEAKQYLRDYFLIPENATAYQENDLMLGIRYMVDISRQLRMPLIICITLGTNQGGHTGTTPFENVLTSAQFNSGICVITGTGNEGGKGHHFYGRLENREASTEVELLVDEETSGFTIEFWADAPDLFSIGFTSPLGETIQPVQPRTNTSLDFSFLLEYSRITLSYFVVEMLSGAQLALIRFRTPTPGIWRIRVVSKNHVSGVFHMWLPISGLVDPAIRFYAPSADTTLVTPSCASSVITASTYNAYNNSLYINSGRGYTRNGLIKPDFAAPGVNLSAPVPGGRYSALTGSCAASALTAGAAALLMEGGLRRDIPRYFTTAEIRSLFLRGTQRSYAASYPNREWGYGTMNIYETFESFLRS